MRKLQIFELIIVDPQIIRASFRDNAMSRGMARDSSYENDNATNDRASVRQNLRNGSNRFQNNLIFWHKRDTSEARLPPKRGVHFSARARYTY
jgi:hypothetical protein